MVNPFANSYNQTIPHHWQEDITFADLHLSFCHDFKRFLQDKPQLRESRRGIGHNSALSYFNKFRTALKQAWREKLIDEDLHAMCPGLKEIEAEVEFLTMAEVQQLLRTPVLKEIYRRVVLFAILSGLRFCDIKYLHWKQVRGYENEYYLQFRQQKTLNHSMFIFQIRPTDYWGNRETPRISYFLNSIIIPPEISLRNGLEQRVSISI